MSTNLKNRATLKVAVLGLLTLAMASVSRAQQNYTVWPWSQSPALTVTAGQGGYVALPDLRPPPQTFALTGEPSPAVIGERSWQSHVGPVYRGAQSNIFLPMAR